MLVIIGYSCFTSAFFLAFDFPTNSTLIIIEHVVLALYSIEIILKCMRLPIDAKQEDRSHLKILKAYMKSGRFFIDLLATFPFYLIDNDSEAGGSSGSILKLLRLVRIPKILNLIDQDRVSKLIQTLVSGQQRQKKVVQTIFLSQVFKVIRLVVLTIIITYFTGCLFYFVSYI